MQSRTPWILLGLVLAGLLVVLLARLIVASGSSPGSDDDRSSPTASQSLASTRAASARSESGGRVQSTAILLWEDLPGPHRPGAMERLAAEFDDALSRFDSRRSVEVTDIDCSSPPCLWRVEYDVFSTGAALGAPEEEEFGLQVADALEDPVLGSPSFSVLYAGGGRAYVLAWWTPPDMTEARLLELEASADERVARQVAESRERVLRELGLPTLPSDP